MEPGEGQEEGTVLQVVSGPGQARTDTRLGEVSSALQ